MFEKIGHFAVKRRVVALIGFIVFVLAAGGIGSQVFTKLSAGGYSVESSDSFKVYDYIKNTLKQSDPTVVLMVDAGKNVDDPSVASRAIALEKKISTEPGVLKTLSYWSSGSAPALKSNDGNAAYIMVYGNGGI